MSIKEAFSRMNVTDKERMALEATLRGIDLETVFNAMDNLAELLKPLYEKNLAALGADQPAATNAPEEAGNEKWETDPESLRARLTRCPECGAHTTSFIDGMCHACWDDRHTEEA